MSLMLMLQSLASTMLANQLENTLLIVVVIIIAAVVVLRYY